MSKMHEPISKAIFLFIDDLTFITINSSLVSKKAPDRSKGKMVPLITEDNDDSADHYLGAEPAAD